jgi:LacI family transcriptional regulator
MNTHRPDVVFTLYNCVMHWIADMGLEVPRDVGVVQLEWRASRPEVAGMNQHNEVTGAAAVDMVINQIHNHEAGVPEFPRATIVGTTWMDGASVRASQFASDVEMAQSEVLATA